MTDQVQNPDINSSGQGLPPVIPPAPNPGPAAAQPAQNFPVEPVPLPKATDVETPIEAGKPAEPNPLFEKPEMVAPGQKEEGKRKKEEGHRLPKGVVAGVAALVFLVVGGLGTGMYLLGQRQEVRTLAEGCHCASGSEPGYDCVPNREQCGENGFGCCPSSGGGGGGGGGEPPRPTDPPPQQGCVSYDGPDCGGDNQGFCTRCPDGPGGRTEYYCKPPNIGSGGGCRAPGGGGGGGGGGGDDTSDGRTEYVTFSCPNGCDSIRQCHENFSFGNNPGACNQVDRCRPGKSDCVVVSLCDASCSGGGGGGGGGGEGPTATATPVTISANCESLGGQVSDGAGGWTTKTDAEFIAVARPGDKVRFVCTGHKTQGNFTKSAFFINNVLHVDDVVKLNETQFAVEYTIGAAGALKVESVLLHDSKGWVD